jgi:hypothetical protein
MARGRQAYNRVSNGDATATVTATATSAASSGSIVSDTSTSTGAVPDDNQNDVESQQHQSNDGSVVSTGNSEQDALTSVSTIEERTPDDDGERITVVIMDPAQNKFDVSVNPSWNVGRLKKEGVAIHKIARAQQRLIFMGRMLADETTLAEAKIQKDGVIIHLFPKPRVVVQSSSLTNNHNGNTTVNMDEDSMPTGGAHVPQIILDPDEAQMRSQILVLGSAEILDAQNNVKLLSFLLIIITSMELLALFMIMLGIPQEPDEITVDDQTSNDDATGHHNSHHGSGSAGGPDDIRMWRNSDYFDLALNLFGFYAAMLGIKAATDNTRRLAFRYLICTIICGVFWNAFYFYLNFEVEQEIDQKEGHSLAPTSDLLVQAFFAILIPMMIWCMCCMRAHQFHALLEEAEVEAEERIQSELQMQEEGNAGEEEENAESQVGILT